MAISARDRITRLTVYANESDMIDDINGTDYTDGVVDGTQRFEHIKFNSLPGFGEANAAMYKCEISGTTDLTGKWIRVRYCFYDTDSATTRTVEAVFAGKVDSCKYDRYHISRSLVAYDKIYDMRNIDISDWWSNYWSTANDSTAFEVFDAMCTSFGVFHMLTSSDFRNNFTILKDAQKGRKLGGCSFADFLRYVGQINGFYWEVLPSGMLTCTAPTASYPQSFDTYTDFKETTIEDADNEAYGTFTVYDGADVIYTSGTGEPTYTFSNNILLYGHTTASLVSILDITKNYLAWFVGTRPATVEVIYSQIPSRQAISVTDNGTPRTCVISKNEMWGAQLINQRLTCTGNRVIGTQYSSALNRAANDIQKIGVELTYKVNADNVIEAVNLEAQGGVTINAEALNINGVQSANGHLKVGVNGDVEIEGKVTADEGDIGGWAITDKNLQKEWTYNGDTYRVRLSTDTTGGRTSAIVVEKKIPNTNLWESTAVIDATGTLELNARGGSNNRISIYDSGTMDQYGDIGYDALKFVDNLFIQDKFHGEFSAHKVELKEEINSASHPSLDAPLVRLYKKSMDNVLTPSGAEVETSETETKIEPSSIQLNTTRDTDVSSTHTEYHATIEGDGAYFSDGNGTWSEYDYNGMSVGNDTRVSASELKVDSKDILRTHQSLVGGYGTAVASGANLNTATYNVVGRYWCQYFSTAAGLSNCPTRDAFMMDVFAPIASTIDDESGTTTIYRTRKIMTYTGDEYVQYNYHTSAGWYFGGWRKLATDKEQTFPSLIGVWGTAVSANANLNSATYCSVGRYYCAANSTVATLSNCPTFRAFTMTVENMLNANIAITGNWQQYIRKLHDIVGDEFVQQVATNGSGGVVYGAWRTINGSLGGTLTANTGSFSESHCRQTGSVVDIHAWLENLSTSTQTHERAILVTGVSLPSVPVRFVCTCWLNNSIAAYAGYGVLNTNGYITFVKAVANSNKVSFAISYVV